VVTIQAVNFNSQFVFHNEFDAKVIEFGQRELAHPLEISLPLRDHKTQNTYCMQQETTQDETLWQQNESACPSKGEANCCPRGFGTFAIQRFELGFGFTKPNSPLFYCLIVDVLLCLLMYIGRVLDNKRKWLREDVDLKVNRSDHEIEEVEAADKTAQLPEIDKSNIGGERAAAGNAHSRQASVHGVHERISLTGNIKVQVLFDVDKKDNTTEPVSEIELQEIKLDSHSPEKESAPDIEKETDHA